MDADCIKLTELKALVIRPGEVLVLQADQHLGQEEIARIREIATEAGVRAIVIGGGLTVAGVQRADGGIQRRS